MNRFDNAARFIQHLLSLLDEGLPAEIIMPRVTYEKGEKINLYWDEKNGFKFDLNFEGNGLRSYYAKLPNGEEFSEELGNAKNPLPEDILNQIVRYDYQWK